MINKVALSCLRSLAIFLLIIGTIGCSQEEQGPKDVPPAAAESQGDPEKAPPESLIPAVEETKAAQKKESKVSAVDDKLPDEIVILSSLWAKHTKGPVTFSHEKHMKDYSIACSSCHHVYQEGNNVWSQGMSVDKCEVCHNEPTVVQEKKLSPEVQKKNLKLAFHNNCVYCHQKLKKEKPEAQAPTTCSKCHEKKAAGSE